MLIRMFGLTPYYKVMKTSITSAFDVLDGIRRQRTIGIGDNLPFSSKLEFCFKHPDLLVQLAYKRVLILYLLLKVTHKELLAGVAQHITDHIGHQTIRRLFSSH